MSLTEAAAMVRNQNYRMAGVEATPELAFVPIYNRATRAGVRLHPAGDDRPDWWLQVDGKDYWLHRAKDALRLTHIGAEPGRRVYNRYTDGGRFVPDPGDTIVDVGAFVGEFSWQVRAEHDVNVVAIEPDPRNGECLAHNAPRARIEHCGAWHERDALEFQIAADGSETGLLQPDKGDATPRVVPTKRVDSIVESCDFAKVEAEGVEPEVLEGMADVRPKRIVVNVSPERDGKSPVAACRQILDERGYDCRRAGDELFAIHRNQ
jgi:FkbM family methyltransferase